MVRCLILGFDVIIHVSRLWSSWNKVYELVTLIARGPLTSVEFLVGFRPFIGPFQLLIFDIRDVNHDDGGQGRNREE